MNNTKNGYLTIEHGSNNTLGTLKIVLYEGTVPNTVSRFIELLSNRDRGYKNCSFHRLIPGFMIQGGEDLGGKKANNDDDMFDDENFYHKHSRVGTLSMANCGPNTNTSQFFITFRKTSHLDGKHVVFGHVDNESIHILKKIEKIETSKDGTNQPIIPVKIIDCGIIETPEQSTAELSANTTTTSYQQEQQQEKEDTTYNEEDEVNELPPPSASSSNNMNSSIKMRLQKLKIKMNQARQLNRQALKAEGEKLASVDGMIRHKKKQQYIDKQLKKEEWEKKNSYAIQVASTMSNNGDVDAKHLVEPAIDSMKKTQQRLEKKESNRFGINDYHNPEGQHRNYVRNLKSIPAPVISSNASSVASSAVAAVGGSYASEEALLTAVNRAPTTDSIQKERDGAKRLANEMHRRIEKQQNKKLKKQDLEFEQTDVTSINLRNKRFNQKINRNYDKHTAEIRQNLERGTAL